MIPSGWLGGCVSRPFASVWGSSRVRLFIVIRRRRRGEKNEIRHAECFFPSVCYLSVVLDVQFDLIFRHDYTTTSTAAAVPATGDNLVPIIYICARKLYYIGSNLSALCSITILYYYYVVCKRFDCRRDLRP